MSEFIKEFFDPPMIELLEGFGAITAVALLIILLAASMVDQHIDNLDDRKL